MHELRAVSGILRTQCGRRGNGPRGATYTASSRPCGSALRPRGSALRPCGSTLSHLVGVGSQPLAMDHGRSAWGACYRARSNQAPSSLPLPSACSGRRDWAGKDCGLLPARRVLSLTWPALAVSQLPLAMDVQSGLHAGAPDQTGLQSRRRHLGRAAGMWSRAGTDRGWTSRHVVFMEGRGRGAGLRSCVYSWAVAGVADLQRHAASPVSGSPV